MRHSLLILAISLAVTAAPLARAQTNRTQPNRTQTTRAQQSTNQTRSTSGTGSTAAQSQLGQPSQLGQMEGVGQISGDERFLRENREAGQMVGGTSVGVGNLAGQAAPNGLNMGRNAAAQGGAFGTRGNFGGQNTFGGQNAFGAQGRFGGVNQFGNAGRNNMMGRQRQTLRVPVGIGFQPPAAAAPQVVSQQVQSRLDRTASVRRMGDVRVEMEGRVAVVRGQVATPHERELVARMLLLEPGIGDVRNELVVAAP
jgi:hypothetical protein